VYKWDVDPRDWAIADAYADGDLTYEQATEMLLGRLQHGWHKYGVIGKVLRNLRPSPGGSFGIRSDSDIVLLHSNAFTVEILDEILRQLTEAGYTFSPLITSWEK
jgi:peptidoglycan/xylan/chitin deacetylase (PgdA/CDA1 family)